MLDPVIERELFPALTTTIPGILLPPLSLLLVDLAGGCTDAVTYKTF